MSDSRTQRERMLAGDLYIADDPVLAAESLRARRLTEAFNRSPADDTEGRRRTVDGMDEHPDARTETSGWRSTCGPVSRGRRLASQGAGPAAPGEVEALGDVAVLSLVRRQCRFGLDTLAWALAGARATSLDLSLKAIEHRRKPG